MADSRKYILFQLNGQTFAAPVQHVISIERLLPIIAVPRTNNFIKGLTEIRGETTAVIDLRERLDLPVPVETDKTRILVVRLNDIQVGFMVDAASEVRDLAEDEVEKVPPMIAGIRDTFLKGVAKAKDGLILILNIENIFDLDETNEIKEVLAE